MIFFIKIVPEQSWSVVKDSDKSVCLLCKLDALFVGTMDPCVSIYFANSSGAICGCLSAGTLFCKCG